MNLDSIDVLQIITKILIIFLVLPIHECAHAWAAHKMGDETAAYSGRLTLNPLAHIDILGALCLLITGFGWAKPVPINPLKFKKQRFGIAITAAAGPLSNLAVSFIAMIIYRIVLSLPGGSGYFLSSAGDITGGFVILYILQFFILVNIGLAIFNLIPIPPLDGSKIISYFTSAKLDRWIYEHQLIVNAVFFAVIITGILSKPLNIIGGYVYDLFWFITNFIPKLMGE
jgi:Zn-dependent protease